MIIENMIDEALRQVEELPSESRERKDKILHALRLIDTLDKDIGAAIASPVVSVKDIDALHATVNKLVSERTRLNEILKVEYSSPPPDPDFIPEVVA